MELNKVIHGDIMTKKEKQLIRKYLVWLTDNNTDRAEDAIYGLGKLVGLEYTGLKLSRQKNIKVIHLGDVKENTTLSQKDL